MKTMAVILLIITLAAIFAISAEGNDDGSV